MKKLARFDDLKFFCPPECKRQIVIRAYASYWPFVFKARDAQSYGLMDPRRITYWVALCDRPRRLWGWGLGDEGWKYKGDEWEEVSSEEIEEIDKLLRWARNYSKPAPPRSLQKLLYSVL